jgi:Ubiquitin-2 like Rad60 SUMO-like
MADESETLTLNVKPPVGDAIQFKVKKTTPFEKILKAYAGRVGAALESFRFMYDGQRINNADTPKMLEIEDGDRTFPPAPWLYALYDSFL